MRCLPALAVVLGLLQALAGPRPQRVLFIGNSLTATNNLPAMVEAIARQRGETVVCETVAFPNYSLDDHLDRGDAVRAIARSGWSVVVLQQGPSALPESQVQLRGAVRKFDAEARRVGARTALYMVWPSQTRRGDFEGVSRSYTTAAADVQALLFAAGDAWRAVWRQDSTVALYGNDGFHPSPMGSYLAALVIYQGLSGKSPVGLPPTLKSPSGAFPTIDLPADVAAQLQQGARAVGSR